MVRTETRAISQYFPRNSSQLSEFSQGLAKHPLRLLRRLNLYPVPSLFSGSQVYMLRCFPPRMVQI
jgi:hypothetical protein